MSKEKFYKTINKLVGTNRIDHEEAYIINDYVSSLESIIKEAREKLNTQLAFTSNYQLNYQSALYIIEEAKGILDKGDSSND